MCRKYHLAYIQKGEVAGAKIIAEATAWSEMTRTEAWEYSVKIRAEADKYRADIQVEMAAWKIEFVA
jgi:hypothetical protein